jgi:MFS family permease
VNRDLKLIALAMFTWGVGEGMFFFFQPVYLQELGANPIQIGTILSGFGVMMAISHIPAGFLADRIGRKPLLVAAWGFGLFSTWIMGLSRSLPIFIVGLMLYGVTAFVMSPLNSYVTAARGKLSIGRVITLISATFNLGAVIGPLIGGRITEAYGFSRTYHVAGVIFIFSTAFISLIQPQPVEHSSAHHAQIRMKFSPRFPIYLGAIFLVIFATYLPQPLTANYLTNQRGLDISQIGNLYSITGIGVVVLNLILGSIPTRYGYVLGQAAVAMFSIILWKATGSLWYYLGFFLLGGFKTARSLGAAQVRDFVQSSRMGLAFGLQETVSGIAVILTPLLAGFLYSRNPTWMYVVSVILIVFAMLFSFRVSPVSHPHEVLIDGPVTTEPTPPLLIDDVIEK